MRLVRCSWCSDDPLYMAYHDQEWGRPLYDEQLLFRQLCLEGQQAGLAWITVLKKRAAYQTHFFQYPIAQIAELTDQQLQQKRLDPTLIRHFGKLRAIRDNARAWQNLKHRQINPVIWLWQFAPQKIKTSHHSTPTYTTNSVALANALKMAGFKFIGPTICYAFMQAVGMVNDHEPQCFLTSSIK